MSDYLLKTILAGFFLLTGLGTAWAMLTVMGAPEKSRDPARLRKIHRVFGYAFGLVFAVLAVLGAEFIIEGGDQLSLRAVLHGLLAVSLLFIFLFKIVLVRFYRSFLRLVPTLGMTVLILALVVFAVSAGFYVLRSVFPPEPAQAADPSPVQAGDAGAGAVLYARQCGSCHFADSAESKVGPGLKGLFAADKMPFSAKPATEENVRQQLLRPAGRMPAFASLSEREIADLVAYLRTL
jgi:mono/diheme cytochrome c family protein